MAKTQPSQDQSQASAGAEEERPGEEVTDEVPAGLLAWLAHWLPQVTEVHVQRLQSGSWISLSRHLPFGKGPPDRSPHEIVRWIHDLISSDVEKMDAASDRYRVMVWVNDKTRGKTRIYHQLAAAVDGFGNFGISDLADGLDRGRDQLDFLNRTGDLAIRSLEAIVKSSEGMERVFNSVAACLGGCADMASKFTQSSVELRKIEMEEATMKEEAETSRERMVRLSQFLDKLAPSLAHLIEEIPNMRREAKVLTLADETDAWFKDLPAERLAKFRAIFEDDELAILEAMRTAADDAAVVALAAKLEPLLTARFKANADAFSDAVVDAVGASAARKFQKLYERIAKAS